MGVVRRDSQKVYLENVRKISWDTGEMCEFASSLASALNILGEDIPYAYLMGVSGAAFRFTFKPGEAWEFGTYSIRNISPHQYEPIRRSFAALGYAYSIRGPATFQEDADRIMGSLERGVPVLAFPVVGPSDCCILTGYDDGGQVVMGWSTFQDIPDDHNIPHDPTGYFRKPGWHENLQGYILIEGRTGRPEPRQVYLDALAWAVSLMRMTGMKGWVTGLEGLLAWAEAMRQPVRLFPEQEEAYYSQFYLSTAIQMTMLRDHCLAEPFLLEAIKSEPDFEPELAHAIDCYAKASRIRDNMDLLINDNFSPEAIRAITVLKTRSAYADAILQIRELEQEAVAHMEDLLVQYR